MTRYLMSMCYPEGSTPPSSDELESIMADITEIRRQLQAEGSWVFAGGLHDPSTATVVRSQDGTAVTTDGPFIDSKAADSLTVEGTVTERRTSPHRRGATWLGTWRVRASSAPLTTLEPIISLRPIR